MKKRRSSLKGRLLSFCFFMIGFVFLISILVMAADQIYLSKEQKLLEKQHLFALSFNQLEEANRNVYAYAQTPSDTNKKRCQDSTNDMIDSIAKLKDMLDSPLILDCYYMMKKYGEQTEELFLINRDSQGSNERLEQYTKIDRQNALIRKLHQNFFSVLEKDRDNVQRELFQWNIGKTVAVVIATGLILSISVIFVFRFAKKLLGPIEHLTADVREIQKKFRPQQSFLPIEEKDETQVLLAAFHEMVATIEAQIQELEKKAILEQKLKEEEISKLEIQAKLDRTQLKMLQSRVNPHFLFNVLNLIGEFAFLENAERTEDVIIRTRDYLRYSLANLDKVVTVKKELDHVRDYFMIQKLRFGKRLEFEVHAEEVCLDALVPAMILQPLAENSMIHGIGPLTKGGSIWIDVRKEKEQICCIVEDNGCGIEEEKLLEIQKRISEESSYDDTQGIGLVNVIWRMRVYFHGRIETEIESKPNVKTRIVIRFPYQKKEKGEEIDVQDFIGG